MYKNFTAEDLKSNLNLPSNYKVDALIVYGGWDHKRYKRMLLSNIEGKYEIEKLSGFIEPIVSIKVKGKRIWFCVEYGGARLSEYVHFASMMGSKKNILLGTCGGLKKGMPIPSILVPNSSYSTESSCHMYMRQRKENKFFPSKQLSEDITKKLKKEGIDTLTGPSVTCQAMMGETWKDIVEWSERGFFGVEMEASTVFAVSEHFNVPAAAMLQVADNLIEKETVHSESYQKKKKIQLKIRKKMFSIAISEIL